MQKQETGWCAQRCGARARQERCPGASCRENSPQGLGVQETPSLGWKGRGHRALQLRDTPILAYPFLSRTLGQVGAPPSSGAPLSSQQPSPQQGKANLPWVPGDLSGAGGPPCLACPGNNRLKTHEQLNPVKSTKPAAPHPPRCPPQGC